MRKLKNEKYIVHNLNAGTTGDEVDELIEAWERKHVPENIREFIEKECKQ
jgi:hypothetical protein